MRIIQKKKRRHSQFCVYAGLEEVHRTEKKNSRWIAHSLTRSLCGAVWGSLTHLPKVTVKIFLIKLKVRGCLSPSVVPATLAEVILALSLHM